METRRTFLKQMALAGVTGLVASRISWARIKGDTKKTEVTLEQAWALHKKCLIIDGHNDVPMRRMAKNKKRVLVRLNIRSKRGKKKAIRYQRLRVVIRTRR